MRKFIPKVVTSTWGTDQYLLSIITSCFNIFAVFHKDSWNINVNELPTNLKFHAPPVYCHDKRPSNNSFINLTLSSLYILYASTD